MLQTFIETYKPKIEAALAKESTNSLDESMQYSLTAGGKRLRPLLTLAVLSDLDVAITPSTLQASLAVEYVHTYSLIHDDLPAMDDDDLRRGKPTNHVMFGEALAILAGDALLTDAFTLITQLTLSDEQKVALIRLLSTAAGSRGMVLGQMLDIMAEREQLTVGQLKMIHEHKTGALLSYAIQAGCILANVPFNEAFQSYGEHLGLAFQIRDDILDVTGDAATLGKTPGKDEKAQKSTYVRLLGLEESRKQLQLEVAQGIEALEDLPYEMSLLKAMIQQLQEV